MHMVFGHAMSMERIKKCVKFSNPSIRPISVLTLSTSLMLNMCHCKVKHGLECILRKWTSLRFYKENGFRAVTSTCLYRFNSQSFSKTRHVPFTTRHINCQWLGFNCSLPVLSVTGQQCCRSVLCVPSNKAILHSAMRANCRMQRHHLLYSPRMDPQRTPLHLREHTRTHITSVCVSQSHRLKLQADISAGADYSEANTLLSLSFVPSHTQMLHALPGISSIYIAWINKPKSSASLWIIHNFPDPKFSPNHICIF